MPEPLPQPSPGPNINFVHHQTKKPKWKIITMIVVIILGLANLGAYTYRWYVYNGIVKFINSQPSRTPRPTTLVQSGQFEAPSDWKTYRNEEYGFEFKYPNGWSVTEGRELDVYLRKTDSNNFPEISVEIIQSATNLDLKNIKEDLIKIDTETGAKVSGESTNLADGSNWFITRIVVNHNSRNYQIQADNFEEELLNQILSTFKFIPSTGSGQVSPSPEFCIQVITPARNAQTGEVRDFPTPCDVPEGWSRLSPDE